MSEQTIFIIGAVIFAITIYGAVMAGGLALTRVEANESDELDHEAGSVPVPSEGGRSVPDAATAARMKSANAPPVK
jgi:hypothetical protein